MISLVRTDVILLFEWHRYNVPLEGALEWEGKRYWFSADPEIEDYGQVLRVMNLDAEQWARVDREQELFVELVGTHMVYDRVTQQRDLSGVKRDHQSYYERPEYDPDWLPQGPVVAEIRMWDRGE